MKITARPVRVSAARTATVPAARIAPAVSSIRDGFDAAHVSKFEKVTGATGRADFASRFGGPAIATSKQAMLAENPLQERAEKGLTGGAAIAGGFGAAVAFTGANPANFTLLPAGVLIGAGEGLAVASGVGAAAAIGVGIGLGVNELFEAVFGKTIGDAVYDATEDEDEGESEGAEGGVPAAQDAGTTGSGTADGDSTSTEGASTDTDSSDDDGNDSDGEDDDQATEAADGTSDASGASTESENDSDGDGDSDASGSTPNPENETSNGQTVFGATGGRLGDKPGTKSGNGAVDPANDEGATNSSASGVVASNGKGGCDVNVADKASLDRSTLLRLKLHLQPGGIRA